MLLEIPKEFFTLQSMLTLTGATVSVFIISNGIQTAFNYNPRWLALLIALIISIAGVYFSNGTGSDYFVGIINGFLIYATACGTTQVLNNGSTANTQSGTARGNARTTAPTTARSRRSFLSPWW